MSNIRKGGTMMYCKKCGAKLEKGNKFCGSCGSAVTKHVSSENEIRQPTRALVVEGIGILFFLYLLLVNSMSDTDISARNWLEDNGAGVFIIGLIFMTVSFFMFKKYKKENSLYGLGYAGYVISCIAIVLLLVMFVLSILTALPVILLN